MHPDTRHLTLDGNSLQDVHSHLHGDANGIGLRELRGVFSGTLSLMQPTGSPIDIDGSLIDALTIGRAGTDIHLKLPSPVPDYNGCPFLEIVLKTRGTHTTLHFGEGWDRWLVHNPSNYSAPFNIWMQTPDKLLPALRNRRFPLGEKGLGIAQGDEQWSADLDIAVGIFPDPHRKATLVLMPIGYFDNGGYVRAKGLNLDQLEAARMGGDRRINSWTSAPCAMCCSLAGPPLWQAVTYWSPFQGQQPGKQDHLEAAHLFDAAWNDVVRAMRAAQRTNFSAQPWIPIPTIAWLDEQSTLVPWLRFDIGAGKDSRTRLSQIILRPAKDATFSARLDWQDDAILAKTPTAPPGLANLSLILGLRVAAAPPAWSTWAAELPAMLDAGLARASDPTLLADWTFAIDSIRSAGDGKDWIGLGSLEFSLVEAAPGAAYGGSLRSKVRGEWSATRRDLYPEMALRFTCRVRVSPLSDPGTRELEASLDSANLAEERMHKDTEPLRIAIGSGNSGRLCTLVIKHVCAPGRNPVTSMEVNSLERSPLGGEALYFQARPFVVARTQAIDIDDQAGQLIAAWRSDDNEGAQWRVPDTELAFSFPPQAVGEEMERGMRFWEGAVPTIDPNHPLRFRFSPPTRLVVQPSAIMRRYNKNPNNLGEVLAGAKVKSFVTELAYPLEVTFHVSDLGEPDVRIAETASFLGRPAPNLPTPPHPQTSDLDLVSRWIHGVLSAEMAAWADVQLVQDSAALNASLGREKLLRSSWLLRQAHSANRANFSARLGQFHLYDPWRKDGGLHLRDGLHFRIRDADEGKAPPLMNPLPCTAGQPVDLLAAQKEAIAPFLLGGQWGNAHSGSLRAGIVHTIEFPSELVAILRAPHSTSGAIERLAFTALGANASASAAFDEGRTEFVVETQHGQLSRITKVRIGRIGVMWNRAKHVIVYERTTVPSHQFLTEQPETARTSKGWPILRKTAEYVEPIDIVRQFDAEAHKDVNATGFVDGCEFISQRIYVNGAWGKDLGHGYELPLWNRGDSTGFYPKPQLALRTRAGAGADSRCWLDEPEHLYFYSNTEAGLGNDPDRWPPKMHVDSPSGTVRLPVLSGSNLSAAACLDKPMMPPPSLGGARRPRFDLSVVADGKVNLQHGRGETEMLSTLNMVALARTDEVSSAPEAALADVRNVVNFSGQSAALEERLAQLLAQLPQRILESGLDCAGLKTRLLREVNGLFAGLQADMAGLTPAAGLVQGWAYAAKQEMQASLSGLGFAMIDSVGKIFQQALQEAKGMRDHAMGMLEASTQVELDKAKAVVLGRVEDLSNGAARALTSARDALASKETLLQWNLASARQSLVGLQSAIAQFSTPVTEAQVRALATQCSAVRGELAKAAQAPVAGAAAARLANALAQVESLATLLADRLPAEIEAIRSCATAMVGAALTMVDAAAAALGAMLAQARTTLARLDASRAAWTAAVATRLAALSAVQSLAQLRSGTQEWIELLESTLAGALEAEIKPAIAELRKIADDQCNAIAATLLPVASAMDGAVNAASRRAAAWIGNRQSDAVAIVEEFDCTKLDVLRDKLAAALKATEQEIRDQVTGALSGMADDTARKLLEDLPKNAEKLGKGIKLAKAIGELPALPTLSFNAARAEYLFEDLEKQITTSPFAARLREIEGGLKELGLAVPTQKLLDQLVPDNLKDVDFSKVFKNLGGLDFQDFFKRFKLPKLAGDKIKITHGVDKDTRSAWAKAAVNADFPEEQTLFECASMAVRLSNMQLRATSDTRITADGQNRSVTEGRFVANWGLDFGGTRMAAFDDVTVKFDGSGFNFNISPDKVRLHPSLKFIEEFAKRFQEKVPPAIQLERDERGTPVGVRANFSTLIDKLPPLPPVTVGPLLVQAGMGLRMSRQGVFEVTTFVGLGSKKSPVFVQFGYLGGGFWIEGKCTAKGSDIVPSASLGLAVGSMRAIDLASVARGSYSLLLFAYAEIGQGGGSVRAGMSIQGSARILGVANASLDLLLEVEHANGKATARGWLHVEIEICWCYTLRVDTAAEHKF